MLGLRSGASRAEIQGSMPGVLFEEVPYLDPQVGEVYRYLYGGLATLRIEGQALVQRGPLEASLNVTLTGDRALYHAQANVREPGVSCEQALARLRERYGPPTSAAMSPTRLGARRRCSTRPSSSSAASTRAGGCTG